MASLAPNNAVLGEKYARHLLKRTTFTYTQALVRSFSSLTLAQAIDSLFEEKPLVLALPYDPTTKTGQDGKNTLIDTETGLPKGQNVIANHNTTAKTLAICFFSFCISSFGQKLVRKVQARAIKDCFSIASLLHNKTLFIGYKTAGCFYIPVYFF
ncbi:MAG: hypothetical protein KA713_18590 [Chryseotalea sp. WA131a]|nr:MAG: hypothetical protein KA713_18590 [Chryseotalea sp. WA131a]